MEFLYNYAGPDKWYKSKLASMYLEAWEGTSLLYMHINQNLELVFQILNIYTFIKLLRVKIWCWVEY